MFRLNSGLLYNSPNPSIGSFLVDDFRGAYVEMGNDGVYGLCVILRTSERCALFTYENDANAAYKTLHDELKSANA